MPMIAAMPAATSPPQKTREPVVPTFGCRITASTRAPTVPMAPASVGVARPISMVPSTRKISTPAGMIPARHFFHSAQPCSVRSSFGTPGTHSGLKTPRANV
jgi:hypothetical protein